MLRLLILVVLAIAPLIAAAHGNHQHANPPVEAAKAPALELGTVGILSAPSHCPTGSGSVCCCHGFSCTTPFDPVAAPSAAAALVLPVAAAAVPDAQAAPRSATFFRFSPRGPPLFS